ncbi:MAG: cupin [Chroococcus sp. CMT-3BRIN-NPC107]|jgi:dTDP-4-dehydrorhamnose 3,5-epimerase-like enzyme|nr:cupin [Chroococcus sp. CMT-3BRIN-NPC107]
MSTARGIEIRPLTAIKGGMTDFYTPQTSDQTILVQISAHSIEDLFVHKAQTDQLLVVKGRIVLVTLINRCYEYIALSDRTPVVAIIPPGVLHGAINLDSEPCVLVNAVLRHGEPNQRDYIPRKPPIPYDLAAVRIALTQTDPKVIAGACVS